MKKIIRNIFIMICVLVMPFVFTSCDINDLLNSITGNTVKLEAGTYFVTTYKVNGEEYSPISEHDMIVTETTITFGNGQMGYYELSGNKLTISNQQGMSLEGTLKYSNGTYTANLELEGTKVYFQFVKKEPLAISEGTYYISIYEVNGEEYEPISKKDMIVTETTITFGNGQMGYYELNGNRITISNQQGMSLVGTIEYNNGKYSADLTTDGSNVHLVFSKKA